MIGPINNKNIRMINKKLSGYKSQGSRNFTFNFELYLI